MSELQFNTHQLPPANARALLRVTRAIDDHVPGLFRTVDEPVTGVQAASIHFAEVVMNGMPADRSIHIHARSHGTSPSMAEADTLALVTGTCLFGRGRLLAIDRQGNLADMERPGFSRPVDSPIVEVATAGEALYLTESTARLGRVAASVAALGSRQGIDSTSFAHIPAAEYRIQAETSYALGRLSLEALEQYCGLLEIEAATARALFSRIFEQCGVEPPIFGSPLDHVVTNVDIGSLTPDHFTKTPFVSDINDIPDMPAASYASYIQAHVRAASSPETLPVFVYSYDEQKIFKGAKAVPDFHGLAIYPLPNCTSNLEPVADLFYHDTCASPAGIQQAANYWTDW